MPAEPNQLFEYVEHHFSDHEVHLVYEAGCCGFHAARYFLNLGWNVLVINPADIRRSDKDRYQKTDKIDARNLSNQFEIGSVEGDLYSNSGAGATTQFSATSKSINS